MYKTFIHHTYSSLNEYMFLILMRYKTLRSWKILWIAYKPIHDLLDHLQEG